MFSQKTVVTLQSSKKHYSIMKRSAISFFLLLIIAFQASAYKKQSININVNGQQRNMVVFTPNSLPPKSPLFIVTHGMNQDPEYQYGSDKMYEMIDTAKFVITYLRSDGNTWDTGGTKDQNFVIKTIDEMASRYDIDKDRVYWSGFSMGSMLIHHCIGNMQNKIAAFAPTSGIQFSEEPWNNCKKPVNLLEVIAYGDETFGYEQYNIHGYIESYALHDHHTRYSKTIGYKPAGFITGFFSAFLNTLFFMSALILLFGNTEYVQGLMGGKNVIAFVCAFVGVNAVFEMIVSTIVTGGVVLALYKAKLLPIAKKA